MEKKAKIFVLVAVTVILIVAGLMLYYPAGNSDVEKMGQKAIENAQKEREVAPAEANKAKTSEGITKTSGKIRSITKTDVYVELSDGKGFAAKIVPTTPVVLADGKKGTLADLKVGAEVTVETDSKGQTVEILVKK
jgi:hypothetical protein